MIITHLPLALLAAREAKVVEVVREAKEVVAVAREAKEARALEVARAV